MDTQNALNLLSVEEAAEVLKISKNTLWRLVHARKIASIQVGRQRRISMNAVHEFLQRGTVPAVA